MYYWYLLLYSWEKAARALLLCGGGRAGLLTLPGQTPPGFGGKEITGSSCHKHVGGYLGALISKAMCGSIGSKLHSRKLCFVSGHGEDCLNNR